MKRRTYTGFVTARPAKEVASKDAPDITALQEISSGKPTLYVPQEDTELADRVRALMLYDAALTPADMPGSYGIPSWALDTARLIRAEQYAPKVTTKPTGKEMADLQNLLAMHYGGMGPNQHYAAIRRIASAYGDGYVPWNGHTVDTVLGSTPQGALYREHKTLNSWEEVLDLARQLAEMGKDEKPIKAPGQNGKGDEEGEGEGEGEGEASYEPADDNDGEADMSSWSFADDPWFQGRSPNKNKHGTNWGILANPNRPDVLPMVNFRKPGTARKRPEMEGVVPSMWHRLLVDGKLFKGAPMRGKSRGRGTIMVDMSGSMSWDYDSFQKMLHVVPECSVYGYSGEHNLRKGRLVLLADRGRCANMKAVENWRRDKGANLVDGPALLFLAKMSAPRLWISDNMVTGKGECRTPALHSHVKEICASAGIKRIRDSHFAADVLSGKHRGEPIT